MDVTERSARLATSIHRELKRAEGISALAERQKFRCIAIPDPIRTGGVSYDHHWLFVIVSCKNQSIMAFSAQASTGAGRFGVSDSVADSKGPIESVQRCCW
ncbi:hypothetical protein F5Y07DRAFT_321661 [Xylaria sp. FL0933]|nr:hypothetical protein F5Y07DRAFT_321661 [Xylaria sp. FL0933]